MDINEIKKTEKTCEICGCEFATCSRGRTRRFCYNCIPSNQKISVGVKQKLIEKKGGKCQRCGYDKCSAALHFHHRDPKTKSFNITRVTGIESWEILAIEADKCDLLCANCHAEVHWGE